jgi:translocation and assembly module TamB
VGRFDLMAWNAGHALGLLTGDLALKGDHTGFQAQGNVTAPGLQCGPLDAQFSGSYSARVLSVSQLRLHHAASGTVLQAQGSVTVVKGGPRLDLHGDWNHFRWPLADGNAPFHSEHGVYTLQDIRPYAFTTQADLHVGEQAPLQIGMRGRLASDGLIAQSAQIQALGAHADVSGRMHWSPLSDWQLQGRVSELDVARLRPQTSGQLNFSFAAAGEGFNSQAPLQASISDLSGNVHAQRAQGHAQLAHRNGEWTFTDVRLQLGATRIELDGRAGSSVDLNFAVNAADLGLLNADARGQIVARGHIRGDLHDPTIVSNAQARNLQWHGALLQSLDANIEFDPSGSGRADSTVRLQGLKLGDRTLEQLIVHSEGTTANHLLTLQANAQGLTVGMRGNGHYAAGAWQGEINAGQFGDAAKLRMTLEAPAPLLLGAERVRLEPLCFHDSQTRLCLNATLEQMQRNVELMITNLPMRALTAGLTAATDYDGSLSVAVNATGNGDEPWRGTLKAQLADAAIHKHFSNGRTETLDLGNGTVNARVEQRDLSADLSLDAQAAGRIAGKFTAHGSDDDWQAWPLNGELSIETTALGYVSAYVGQIDRASGRVNAQLHVTGTPASPRLNGELKLIHATLDAYQINLSLRDVNLSAKLTDDTLSLDGSALAGPDGHASVQGRLRWQQGLPYGDLHLVGEDLRIFSVPEARVDASPDVSVHLAGRQIDLHGEVTLPYARIEPANLANAVLSSSDEVMVGDEKPAAQDQYRVSSASDAHFG